jgi:hypothetical protein
LEANLASPEEINAIIDQVYRNLEIAIEGAIFKEEIEYKSARDAQYAHQGRAIEEMHEPHWHLTSGKAELEKQHGESGSSQAGADGEGRRADKIAERIKGKQEVLGIVQGARRGLGVGAG